MADYKELLRRAVEALPENNGAARRAVYEKARAALVGQLRAISPPLPARDITTHRLQLEDCIRQVEQEASEANIAGMGQEPAAPTLPPVFVAETPKPAKRETPPPAAPKAPSKPVNVSRPEPQAKSKPAGSSIEDIIAAAERDRGSATPPPSSIIRPPKSQPVLVAKAPPPEPEDDVPVAPKAKENRALPSIVARAEAAKGRPIAAGFGVAAETGRRGPMVEPRRADRSNVAATARQVDPIEFDVPEDVAMSAVREVEVEAQPADPQGVIDRAIATLDREMARGERSNQYADPEVDDEPMAPPPRRNGAVNGRAADLPPMSRSDRAAERETRSPRPAKEFANPRRAQANRAFDGAVPRAREERGGMGAVTVFLIIFVVLLVGAGGAGFWAYQQGFIDLDAMFGKGTPAVATAATKEPVVTPDSTGPGNTDTVTAAAEPSTQLKATDRLPAAETAVADTQVSNSVEPLALQSPAGASEERLGADTASGTAAEAVAAIDPASVAGSQSLLLEASDNGTTGAVPFSGTVEWSKGQDELGQPTLVGKANIPARNLSVDLLIRKNSDPSLPASHLMEINFTVADSFIGGSIAGLPGVLLKNEELVQGAPLVGASARVVGNSFLFALSAAPEDTTANTGLLTSRKWMDLALIYASGKRAIITLEKDDKAQALFNDVFGAWAKLAAN